jgi:hypothetical protein
MKDEQRETDVSAAAALRGIPLNPGGESIEEWKR